MDLQSDSQITDLKFTSEALSREIEQCVFSLFNNSQDKKYRDKIKKITTRLKGSRNQIVRNPLKRGTLTVEDFCNLDDKKLNEDSYFSKFNPNDNVDEKTNRSKLNIRPPPIKNLPMTSKLDLSSEAYVNDLTAYENNQTNNTEEVNDDNIKNLDAVISSISEEIKKDDDLDKIQTEVKEINNDEIEKEKENTPTGTLSNKVDEGRNLSSDKFNNETVEDKLNKGDLKNNLDDTDTAIENKKQSESKESGNVSHRTKDEQMFKPKNFVKFNPPVKKLASIVKENETHETIQDNNKTNLNQSYSMVSSNTEEKIEEEANLNKSFTSPCSTNNLKRLQEIIANKKREKVN